MKTFLSIGLLIVCLQTSAQWSNTTNEFYDSLHMPVSLVAGDEQNPLVLKSYPDSGYFVIWIDQRNSTTTKTDIYAQKYDKNGNALWGVNGKPVTKATGNQTYIFSSNQDYRSRSFMATDSAGGFYICYTDDAGYYPAVVVQHINSSGTPIFPEPGFIAGSTTAADGFFYGSPLLIPDGKKGFFISFAKNNGYVYSLITVADYRDENGSMKNYGRYPVNENGTQRVRVLTCPQGYVDYSAPGVTDYNIWPDEQGGCNIIMSMAIGNGTGTLLAYNKLFVAKKTSRVTRVSRNQDGIPCRQITNYKADNVYMLYTRGIHTYNTYCDGGSGSIEVILNEGLVSNGFWTVHGGAYDYTYPKGVTIPTSGNVNINLIAVTQRNNGTNGVSNPTVQGYAFESEKYDSIPYEATSSLDPDVVSTGGINNDAPPLAIFNTFRDTLLASDVYNAYPDFSLAAGGGYIYAAALLSNSANTGGSRQVKLQALSLGKGTTKGGIDSFYLTYLAPKGGQAIGSELYTGGSNGIGYEFPRLNVAPDGTALFSVSDVGRSTRVSPISGTSLTWGAMGRLIGTGIDKKSYYGNDLPVAALDPLNGTGIIAWRDSRNVSTAPNTGINIFTRHLDNLKAANYIPPLRRVRTVPSNNPSEANPLILYGTSGATTPIEVTSTYLDPSTTTVATIVDEQNIGRLQSFIYQNSGSIRNYNGLPYLDRNLTFEAPTAPANLNARMSLYFTKTEFDALKAADPKIHSPEDLSIINQPLVPGSVPTDYTPVNDETVITPGASGSIENGYLLSLTTRRFGNFFIMRVPSTLLCPGGSTTFTSTVSGSSYQWAMKTGEGGFYEVINNNANFSGTNKPTLELKNIPSSLYGNKIVCIIDALTYSRVFTLEFVDTWKGTVNGDWNNPTNWSCGTVPDANTDVIINSGSVNVNTNGFCRTLTVKPGAGITVNPGFVLTETK